MKSNYDNFKLLLIDNGSNLENYENLKKSLPNNPFLELCRIENNRGYVGGINFGLERANTYNPEYCLIMNNDTILDVNAISELVYTSKRFDDKAIVSGKVYHYDEPNILQDIGLIFSNKKALKFSRIGLDEEDIGQFDDVSERDLLDDVFWLFPINLYHKIGGYSPYFWFNAEQADFGLRAKKEGYKLIFTPKAKLWHKGSISIGGRGRNPKLAYWHVQSTLIFRYLHLSKIEFSIQYFKMGVSIISSYFKVIREKLKGINTDFGYPNAKLKGFQYFNKWFFLRNENKGANPFN